MMTRSESHDDQAHGSRSRLGARLYPELSLVEEREHRAHIFKTAERRLFRSWVAWVVALPVTVVVILVMHKIKLIIVRAGYIPPWLAFLAFGVAVVAYVFFVSTFLFVRPMRRSIREQLLERGIPVCRHCGYSLHGLRQPRCPECGRPFEPDLLGDRGRGSKG